MSRLDVDTLTAALVGYRARRAEIDQAIANIASQLAGKPWSVEAGGSTGNERRTLSAAARKRISEAQRKRWAAYRAQHR